MPEFILAETEEDYAAAGQLFREYAAWLNINLCFQNFDQELENLQQMYALPNGGIILLKEDALYRGCAGIRRIDEKTAELKRMYIQPGLQGKGFGKKLLEEAVQLAQRCNYKLLWLDTLSHMTPAINLYKKNGFVETEPYYHNPHETVVYLQKYL